jgi:CheY-like chemotaxis protein
VSRSSRSALLVARQPARRRKIATALTRQGVSVVAETAGPRDALSMIDRWEPAMLVVELNAGTDDPQLMRRDENVLEFVRAARERIPGLRVIAVTESLDLGLLARAVSGGAGVDAYVLEPDAR